jgi:hypothetical protein
MRPMVNFEAELDKLLSRETGKLPQYELAELAAKNTNGAVERDGKGQKHG